MFPVSAPASRGRGYNPKVESVLTPLPNNRGGPKIQFCRVSKTVVSKTVVSKAWSTYKYDLLS